MALQLTRGQGQQLFTAHGSGYVSVNGVRYERSVLVTPRAVAEWSVAGFDSLDVADFGFIAELGAEVVIFGTGSAHRFPARVLARALAQCGVGVELMDNGAACRTYNILAADGRGVVAAILLPH